MDVDPAVEARLFGRLALKGVLPREEVEALFEEARRRAEAGREVSLGEIAAERGLLAPDRLGRLAATDGDEVPDLPGHTYERKLGEGGTASVYAVRKPDGSLCAVKMLHQDVARDADVVRAFLSEARLLQELDHPNVLKGEKAGRFAGRYLSFLEYVEGRTLAERLSSEGTCGEEEALYVVLQVARALDYLRQHGVVHRDIKPGNIMITADNEVKVIDLGFALSAEAGPDERATTIGTAAFLSPEQARGQADLDVRSDIYALGATLYQLVLGELPFEGSDDELVQKAVLEGLSAHATKGGRLSAHVHYFIEKMMAKDREIRYQDPSELIEDIESQMSGRKTLSYDRSGASDDAAALRRRRARLRRRRGKR